MKFLIGFFFVFLVAGVQADSGRSRAQTFRPYGGRGGGGGGKSGGLKAEFDRIWTSTGTVPDRLSRVPDSPLYINFRGTQVTPNMQLDTAQLVDKPTLKWDHEKGELYTLIIEDNDIDSSPIKYAHWLVTNIPGDNVYLGDETVSYLPSYFFEIGEDGKLDTKDPKTHRHLVLVYKQKNRKRLDLSGQSGCNKGILAPPRVNDHDKLQLENDLEGPIAGNFYRVGYSQGWSEYHVCRNRKCLGMPFPAVVPGVNDRPECIGPEEAKGGSAGGGGQSTAGGGQSAAGGGQAPAGGGGQSVSSSSSGGRGQSSTGGNQYRQSAASSSSRGQSSTGGGQYSQSATSNSGSRGQASGGRYTSSG